MQHVIPRDDGAKDMVVSPAEQHATATGLRASKEVIFGTQAHMLPVEDHAATARAMLNVLRHDVGHG